MYKGVRDIIELHNRHGYNSEYKKKFINIMDFKALKAWLEKTVKPFAGYSGKIFFPKMTTFPRYKFSEYSKENNQIVRKVRDLKNSDAVILDFDTCQRICQALEFWPITIKKTNQISHEGILMYEVVDSGGERGYAVNRLRDAQENQLVYLDFLYQEFLKNPFDLISVRDLSKTLGSKFEAIDVDKSTQLDSLLATKSEADVKLAMEIMTNCDLETSHFHICLLFAKYQHNMKNNAYWNSTSFRSFRETINALGINVDYIGNRDPLWVVEAFLALDDKTLFEEDILFIKNLIIEEVKGRYTFADEGFELSKFDIRLNIHPSKIIKKPDVEVSPIEEEIIEDAEHVKLSFDAAEETESKEVKLEEL